jgi:predicted GTPase
MMEHERAMVPADVLGRLSRLALEIGSEALAAEAEALAERVAEGRFYVVCVGQFKRGKSTLLNALVGAEVLPTGVIPVTAVVTVLRHGERLGARVRLAGGEWKDCDPIELGAYVSEDGNPGNQKGVTAAEVFVPSALLASGMCLVDTPGLGSVWTANREATRAFVPHIDAALVVLGADPPITGEELAVVEDVARQVSDLVVVLNKADRLPGAECEQASRFTERMLTERLGRGVGPILHVSATERLAGSGARRDWDALVGKLERLARDSGSELVSAAARRGTNLLVERMLDELDEQERALRRPLEESQARLDRLRAAGEEAERSLEDLGHRLTAVEERLHRTFGAERDRFFAAALGDAEHELSGAIRREPVTGPELRKRAIEHAIEVATRWLRRWRSEQEPRAEALYREAVTRFVELADASRESLATIPGAGAATHVRAARRIHREEPVPLHRDAHDRSGIRRCLDAGRRAALTPQTRDRTGRDALPGASARGQQRPDQERLPCPGGREPACPGERDPNPPARAGGDRRARARARPRRACGRVGGSRREARVDHAAQSGDRLAWRTASSVALFSYRQDRCRSCARPAAVPRAPRPPLRDLPP